MSLQNRSGGLAEEVSRVLDKYLSRITADGILRRAAARSGVSLAHLERHQIPALIDVIASSAALFLPPERHSELRDELMRLSAPSNAKPQHHRGEVRSDRDVTQLVLATRTMARSLGANPLTIQKIMTAVSELARNVILYAGHGSVELEGSERERRLKVRVHDEGPGIQHLDAVMRGDYESRTGMGKGLRGVKRMASRFDIETGPSGTEVRAEFAL